jgi:hypothetical protein
MVRSLFGRSMKTYYLHLGGYQIVEVTCQPEASGLCTNNAMIVTDQKDGNGRCLVLNQQELKFLSKGHKRSVPAPISPVCPAVKLRMFSSHWSSNRYTCIYFSGLNWPLSFPPSLIVQFPRHHHSSIHLNRIQSPWSRMHHISSRRRHQLMNTHGVITQKTIIWATSTTTRWTPALPVCVWTLNMRIPVLRLRRAWVF